MNQLPSCQSVTLEKELLQKTLQENKLEYKKVELDYQTTVVNQELIKLLIEAGQSQIDFQRKINNLKGAEAPSKQEINSCFKDYIHFKLQDSAFAFWGAYWVDSGLGPKFQPIVKDEYIKKFHEKGRILFADILETKEKIKIASKMKKGTSLPDLRAII